MKYIIIIIGTTFIDGVEMNSAGNNTVLSIAFCSNFKGRQTVAARASP